MGSLHFEIPDELDGIKIKNYLKKYAGFSSKMITKIKREEHGITVNGERMRTVDTLKKNEILRIELPQEDAYLESAKMDLDIVFEDEYILVINKPPFLLMHPTCGKQELTLANYVMGYFESKGESHAFHPVNRLDKNTSGIVVIAKNAHIAHSMVGSCQKKYVALVKGKLEGEGIIDQPIRFQENSIIKREVGEGGKSSITHWKSLAFSDTNTLVQLELETGRTHQIRVHMKWMGFPLEGDTLYGEESAYIERQALHCKSICFLHPISHKKIELNTDFPRDFMDALKKCGIY